MIELTDEMERAAFEACAAIICNEMCTGDDPTCACHMAVREALKAALATLKQELVG